MGVGVDGYFFEYRRTWSVGWGGGVQAVLDEPLKSIARAA